MNEKQPSLNDTSAFSVAVGYWRSQPHNDERSINSDISPPFLMTLTKELLVNTCVEVVIRSLLSMLSLLAESSSS